MKRSKRNTYQRWSSIRAACEQARLLGRDAFLIILADRPGVDVGARRLFGRRVGRVMIKITSPDMRMLDIDDGGDVVVVFAGRKPCRLPINSIQCLDFADCDQRIYFD